MALVMWMANGEGLLGEGENLHVDGGGSVPSTRLPPSPSSRAILYQKSPRGSVWVEIRITNPGNKSKNEKAGENGSHYGTWIGPIPVCWYVLPMAIITHLGNLMARAIAWIFPGRTSMARIRLSWEWAHFGNGNIEDIAFSFQPILSIPVCPIGASSQIRTPSTLKVGFVAVVLRSC